MLSSFLKQFTEIYEKGLATGLLQKEVDQYIPFALARAGYEKRLIENDNDGLLQFSWKVYFCVIGLSDEGDAEKLFKLLEEAIQTVREGSFHFNKGSQY